MKKTIVVLLFMASLGLFSVLVAGEVYVSPHGSDRNAGTKEAPYLTLNRAIKQAREWRRLNRPEAAVAYLGLVLLHFTDKVQYTTTQLIVWLLIVLVVQVLDYFTPMLGSKYSGGSRWGNWGCIIGTLIGLLFLPWGVIFGPFLGAVIGELLGNKEFSQALRSGVGSLIGFLLGTFLKFVVCGYFCYQFIVGFIRS